MRVPVRWLNDYVKVDDIDVRELADLFLGIGFEVEEIINPSDAYKNIFTGQILAIEKHPNADNLDVITLKISKGEQKTIVTGAKNLSKGDIVPVALDGAVVFGGKLIKQSDFRGVLSEGMLCSGKELDIDDNTIDGAEVDGILILPKNTKVGIPVGVALDVDEYIFDISINSNRPDCNSIFGLAKEIAVKLNRKITPPEMSYKEYSLADLSKSTINSEIAVKIEDYSLCSRYSASLIGDVKIEKSPLFIRKRLISAGLRPINNVVDITNFVLIELGQPLHAFDLEKLSGNIHIRKAKKSETLRALNDEEYKLDENMLVIADDKNALAIAGVMGGQSSAITDSTNTVLLEAARFNKLSVRYTSRAIGLRSDSSARFERGLDYESVDFGRERALNLFEKLGAGKVYKAKILDQIKQPERKKIEASFDQINTFLGVNVPKTEAVRILKSLGFEVTYTESSDRFECIVPLFREDVDNFSDLAEEVIRFYGYENIQSTNMETSSLTRGDVPTAILGARKIRNILCGFGLLEILSFSFIAASDCDKLELSESDSLRREIKILNPLGEDRAFMRTQLLSSMIRTIQLNKSRQNDDIALFELSKVFIPSKLPLSSLPLEPYTLCIGFLGAKYDFYYLKNVVKNLLGEFSIPLNLERSDRPFLHPGISADITIDGKKVGAFGKIHPKVAKNFDASEDIFLLEINVQDFISKEDNIVRVSPLPKFPSVDRDLAVVVKSEVTAGEVIAAISEAAGTYLEKASLFDVYTGGQIEAGYKSMAFSIRFRSLEKTLQDADTQSLMNAILSRLETQCGAKLR